MALKYSFPGRFVHSLMLFTFLASLVSCDSSEKMATHNTEEKIDTEISAEETNSDDDEKTDADSDLNDETDSDTEDGEGNDSDISWVSRELNCTDCTFTHNGLEREYLIYMPDSVVSDTPLVFALHGSGGNASNFEGWIGMNDVAETHGFAVVYPQGLFDEYGTIIWNSEIASTDVDDVGFLSRLAQYLQEEYNLSPERTFTSGFSNGGFMSYYLISKRPDVFKGAASVAGTMSGPNWNDRNTILPAPVLQISGALDNVVPIDGSLSPEGGWGGAPPMEDIIAFWSDLNECSEIETLQINATTTAYINSGGVNGNEVWYYLLDDYGHDFPIEENENLNASALIWDFFSRY